MKILFADDGADIRELVKLTFESYFDAAIFAFPDGNSLIEHIENHPRDPAIVVCDHQMPNGSGADVYQFLVDKNINYPFVLISSFGPMELNGLEGFFERNRTNVFVQKPSELKQLNQVIEQVCINHYKEYCTLHKEEYISFIPLIIERLGTPVVDYYHKIAKDKFVKIISSGDRFYLSTIKKMKVNNRKIYVSRNDLEVFFASAYSALSMDFENEEKDLTAVEFAHQALRVLGLSEQLIKLTEKTIHESLERVESDAGLMKSISKLLLKEDHYLYKHCVLIAYVAISVLQGTRWRSVSATQKICLAAFYHDSFLHENDFEKFETPSFHFPRERTAVDFNPRYTAHPLRAASTFKDYDLAYSDVAKIIEQHHERPDGSGFPRGLTANSIFNLSAIFIISELLAHYILDNKGRIQGVDLWFAHLKSKYYAGPFIEVIDAMESTLSSLRTAPEPASL